jgi:hypothetical protein
MTTEDSRGAGGPGEMSDDVALLVRLAGASDQIPAERLTRVRTAVHGAWRDEFVAHQVQTRHRRLTVAVLLAAAASVVIGVAVWGQIRTAAPVVAHIDHVRGQGTEAPEPFTAGGAVMSGSTVTTSVGTLSMRLTSGVHLRLDASSAVRLDSATDVWLERGAVFVDSAGAPTLPGASPISIHTPAALVRDIGTQFEVRLDGAGLRIRVRDGEVLVTYANGAAARARAGEELFSGPDGSDRSINRRPIGATGSEWAWAERAAPPFSVDGKTCGAFLDWVSREGAWTVTFADSALSAAAREKVVSAGPDALRGLTLADALEVVLPTCGLRHRIDINERNERRVVIEKDPSK